MLSRFSPVWLCYPKNRSPPGSSVHGILQARILQWVAMLSSRGSSRPRNWAHVSCLLHWQAGSLPLAPPLSIDDIARMEQTGWEYYPQPLRYDYMVPSLCPHQQHEDFCKQWKLSLPCSGHAEKSRNNTPSTRGYYELVYKCFSSLTIQVDKWINLIALAPTVPLWDKSLISHSGI